MNSEQLFEQFAVKNLFLVMDVRLCTPPPADLGLRRMMRPSRSGPAWIIFSPGVLEGDLEGVTVFERLEDLPQ